MQSKHNSKLKKHLTRALSLMLAFALALSTPLTTHADVGDSGDNTGGGGGGMSSSTSSLAWSQYHQGYRLYVINQDFVRISKVYDFTYSTPAAGTYDRTTRFDGPDSPSTDKFENLYLIQDLQSWCDSPYDVPTPTKLSNGTRIGNGYEFKQWFFAGEEGNSIDTGNGNGFGGNGGSGGTGTGTGGSTSHPNTVIETLSEDWSEYISIISTMDDGGLENYPPTYMSTLTYQALVVPKVQMINSAYNSYYNNYKSNIGKWFDADGDGVGDDQITESDIKDYCLYKAGQLTHMSFSSAYGDYVGYAMYIVVHGESDFLRLCEVSDNLNNYEEDWAHLNTTDTTSLLFQSIPLAGGEGSGPSPASNLVRKNNTIQVQGYTTPADALQDGCYLVVEPITWLYVRTNNGPWDSPSTYESTRTYGTYWNLASKWVGTGGFYNTIMTKLFNNCLAISRTVTSPTGKTLQGIESTNQKSVADSLNYMNAGYGLSMHISKIHN